MSDDDRSDGKPAYAIGYGKPPHANRFQPGSSGNPKGRPRKATSFGEEFTAMLKRPTTTVINGKRRRLTVIEIAVMRAKKDIATGSSRALERWIPVMERYAPARQPEQGDLMIDYDSMTDEQLRAVASIRLKPSGQ